MSSYNTAQAQNKPKFSVAITTPTYQKLINNTLGEPNRAKRFIATITSSVAVNNALQDCDAGTILAGALLGESLNLSPSPQLGQFYLVPFNDRKAGVKKAQFILGYKGYIQLALRSGYYKKINVVAVKEGEFVRFNPFTEEFECQWIEDETERANAPTIGYAARFEYLNGFQKCIYWSKEKMLLHADKYSQAFSKEAIEINGTNGKSYHKVSFADYEAGNYSKDDEWMYSSFWYKNFDDMAMKTMLRQLISRWGVMSTEMQQGFEKDSTVMEFDNNNNIIVAEDDSPNSTDIDRKSPIQPDTAQNPPLRPETSEVVETVDLDSL